MAKKPAPTKKALPWSSQNPTMPPKGMPMKPMHPEMHEEMHGKGKKGKK